MDEGEENRSEGFVYSGAAIRPHNIHRCYELPVIHIANTLVANWFIQKKAGVSLYKTTIKTSYIEARCVETLSAVEVILPEYYSPV